MSEPKKPVEVEVYKPDTVIKIDLPVAYVQRFNQLMLEGIPFKDHDHFTETLKKVEKGDQDDPYSYHVTTILSFLVMVEEAARKQGHLKTVEINPETQEQTDVSED
tara:strand:+ start:972 stop:1289 length:318 start_codon:yes stop_codon:yes gene_type:complete